MATRRTRTVARPNAREPVGRERAAAAGAPAARRGRAFFVFLVGLRGHTVPPLRRVISIFV